MRFTAIDIHLCSDDELVVRSYAGMRGIEWQLHNVEDGKWFVLQENGATSRRVSMMQEIAGHCCIAHCPHNDMTGVCVLLKKTIIDRLEQQRLYSTHVL